MLKKLKGKLSPILVTLIIIAFLIVLFSIISLFFDDNSIKINTETGLTSSQRNKDFKELCSILESSQPMLYDYSKLYGITYNDIKENYKSRISECKSDYDYYYLLDGFLNCIPSCHTYLKYPVVDDLDMNYSGLNLVNNERPALIYWKQTLESKLAEVNNEYKTMLFTYVDGSYIVNKFMTNFNTEIPENTRLIKVDNIPINEFALTISSEFKIMYDYINNTPYRAAIAFNDSFGTKCTVTVQFENGETIDYEMYCEADNIIFSKDNIKMENNMTNNDFFANEISTEHFYSYKDTINNVAYISIMDFYNDEGEKLKNVLKSMSNIDNVILDLRGNKGGYADYAKSYIYPELFSDDVNFSVIKYIRKNKYTESLFYGLDYKGASYKEIKEIPFESRFKTLIAVTDNKKYEGNHNASKNVIILISQNTASAADEFTYVIKNNNLGTIIGCNTYGEGFCSPELAWLHQSGICFYFSPYKFINPDGSDNSVYGTTPDIYSNISFKGYLKRQKLLLDNQQAYTYSASLRWDDVLIKALEIIKEKETAK
jgi:hypothetical protein